MNIFMCIVLAFVDSLALEAFPRRRNLVEVVTNHANSYKMKQLQNQLLHDNLEQKASSEPTNYQAFLQRPMRDVSYFEETHRASPQESIVENAESQRLEANNSLSLLIRGETRRMQGDYQGSLADLDESLRLEPNNAWALAQRGETTRMLGDYRGSLADLDESLRLDPHNARTLEQRGETKRMLEDYQGSLSDFNESLHLEPKNALALRRRGDTKRMLKDYKGSLVDLNESLRLEPNNSLALRRRGDTKRMLEDYQGSIVDLDESLRLEPNNALALHRRGDSKRILGDYHGTLADLGESLRLEPNNALALRRRGDTKGMLGDYHGALADLDESLRLEPNNTWTLRIRGKIQRMQEGKSPGDPDESLAHNERNSHHNFMLPSVVAGLAALVIIMAMALVMIFTTRLRLKQRDSQLKELQRKLLDSCKTSAEVNTSMPIHEQLDALPYDMKFDIHHSRIKIGQMIGQGNFGLAHKGYLLKNPESRDGLLVVVKMPKGGSKEVENFEVLIQELKMMIYAGDHINVLKLHGAVTDLIQHHKLYVLTEYCSKGSLWEVLVNKQYESNFLKVSTDGYSIPKSLAFDRAGLSLFDLLSYSYQVAHGMEYLAAKNLIHRDLAARNILLNGDDIIKICDFGLSRGGEYYKDKRHRNPLPIKWTPIEAFKKGLFTVKSDVWSYGILNWEIFSLGEVPYSELDIQEVIPKVREGYRLEKPNFAPDAVYEMMRMCWAEEPEERPTFTQCKYNLAFQLELVSKESFKALILKLSSEAKLVAPTDLSDFGNDSAEAYPPAINLNLPSVASGTNNSEMEMRPLMSNPTYGSE